MSSLIVEVCRVDDIVKHPNADKLSIITVKGWNCIVGLDQYKVGELVVFVPPDSIIPDNLIEKYELEYLKNGGRVGTAKLRGCISQGLILDVPPGNYNLGDDVAKVMGITKWAPPQASYYNAATKTTSKKKLNPDFDRYTTIENIQNYNSVFRLGDEVVITEKVHGANFRAGNLPIHIDKNTPFLMKLQLLWKKFRGEKFEFVYGSHNVQITSNNKNNNYYGEDVWGQVARKYNLKEIIPNNCIIYGEVYGKGIQDLTYGLNDIDLVVFDMKCDGRYLPWDKVYGFCINHGLKVVPVLYIGKFGDADLDKFTNGKSNIYPFQIREGCVVKMYEETNDSRIGRKILKSVSPDYLTRKNGTEYQ